MIQDHEPTLTNEQMVVACADPARLTLVQAGAGTGKTHTLVSRIAYLAEESGLDPGDEVLVLSFSRAAVGEVRRRLATHPHSLPFVPVQTFDSFATSLLDLVDPDGPWVTRGYDDRIRAATALVESETEDLDGVLTVRHLLIDEAQDLVGLRARFVCSLLKATGAAFTVFTDSAQAIYGFSSGESTRRDQGAPFVESLARIVGSRSLDRCSLTVQQRAASPDAVRVAQFGAVLTDHSLDAAHVASQLRDLVESLPPAPDLRSLSRFLKRPGDRSTAILCRSNAQALVTAEELNQMEVTHRLQRSADDRAIGSWLASTALRVDGHVLSRRQFDQAVGDLPDLPVPDADGLWLLLRRMDPRGRTEIDLRRVAAYLRRGDIPDELNHAPLASVVVSTIHRAKGLEFDRVVLVPATYDDENQAEENRILYVGLSRARDDLMILPGVRTSGLRSDPRVGRVIQAGYSKTRPDATGLELLGSDSNSAAPAGASDPTADAARLQEYLLGEVAPADPLRLELIRPRLNVEAGPVYAIRHRDTLIGETSDTFGLAIALARPTRQGGWPSLIEGARVQMIDTVAGDETIARTSGLSRAGLWARVRLNGIGRFATSGENK